MSAPRKKACRSSSTEKHCSDSTALLGVYNERGGVRSKLVLRRQSAAATDELCLLTQRAKSVSHEAPRHGSSGHVRFVFRDSDDALEAEGLDVAEHGVELVGRSNQNGDFDVLGLVYKIVAVEEPLAQCCCMQ